MKRSLVLAIALGLMATGCGSDVSPTPLRDSASGMSPASSAAPEPSPSSPDRAPEAPTPPSAAAAEYFSSVAQIDGATRDRIQHSWRPGCPVPLEDLRLLTVAHWGFDGREHRGELVVHADAADGLGGVFRSLFDARYPIERMELVDVYGADDDASMAANNSSGFNCRPVTGNPGVWSEHSFGRAIDLNPVQNPYVTSAGAVLPPSGEAYVDRSRSSPGMIHADDAVVRAFAAIGWAWGGDWTSPKDYQHFSATGR